MAKFLRLTKLRVLLSLLSLISIITGPTTGANACPCGCSGGQGYALQPDEQTRFGAGFTQKLLAGYVGRDSRVEAKALPESVSELRFAAALRVTDLSSIAIEVPLERQSGLGSSHMGPADPTFSYDLNLIPPYQIEVLGGFFTTNSRIGFKPSLVSVEPASDPAGLNQHGNGAHEIRFGIASGIDWMDWIVSGSYQFTLAMLTPQPGLATARRRLGGNHRATVSLDYTWLGMGSAGVAVSRSSRSPTELGSVPINHSDNLSHSIALRASIRLGFKKTLGLTFERTGWQFLDRNIPSAYIVGASFSIAT